MSIVGFDVSDFSRILRDFTLGDGGSSAYVLFFHEYMDKEVYEFISQQTNDPIIERRICRISGTKFPVFQSDKEFYEKISPTFGGKKYLIPFPTLCPEERWRRRLLFKNERKLFKRTCDLTEKSIISIHAPENGYKVYSVSAWRSDKRNPLEYGRSFDDEKSFFEQYKSLYTQVPQIAMMNDNGIQSENIEYCQNVAYSKNCYLTTVARKLEHSYYSSNMAGGNRLLDCFFTMSSEQCYECCDSNNLYGCFRLQYAYNCQNCRFGYDLVGCKDCIACVNLRDKQYCIFNKQYNQQEYETYKATLLNNLHQNLDSFYNKFTDFVQQHPHRATYNTNATDTYSSNLYNADNAILCYNIQNAKDTKYCVFGDTVEDAMDLTVGGELHLCYEGNVPDHSYRACFTVMCRSCTNVFYSEMCHGCKDCFGCVGLKNKQYCILNRQYTKEEYETLVQHIIEKMNKEKEWGEFFPKEIAPFAYNVSTVMDYFPLSREEALKRGYTWRDEVEEINIPKGIRTIDARDVESNTDDSIINKAIICAVSGRPFRILKPELRFYRKWNIPLPQKHPDVRFEERLQRMPEKRLEVKKCDKCGEEMLSVYRNNVLGTQKIYCEACYTKYVYG